MKLFCTAVLQIVLLACLPGCSSDGIELGRVEGTVTLDGAPLDGAEVVFEPSAGRPSFGHTDENGRYELEFTMERKGAMVGPHTVRITSVRQASGGEGDEPVVSARKELLPAKYHRDTELTADVKDGKNTIDFALTSK